jgi:hypothetical protein
VDDEEDTYSFQNKLKDAKTFDFANSKEVIREEEAEWIEPTENADRFDLEKVTGTIKVQGFELDEPPPPDPKAVEKALKRSDPTADYRRNSKEFGIICPVCFGNGKCVECKGRGRVKLIFKCKNCGGSGKCPDCERDIDVGCPQCHEPLSKFSDTCLKCGLTVNCKICGSKLPTMATRCPSCKTIFKCKNCDKTIPLQYSLRCPNCNHWNG